MTKFKNWLLTEPKENDMFFTRIRRTAIDINRHIHDFEWLGHKWDYRGKDEAMRKCSKCGIEEWLKIETKTIEKWERVH